MSYTVYLVENTTNSKIYVGVTSNSLKRRLIEHFSSARCGTKQTFQNAIRKYGREAFEIHALQDAESRKEAFELEKHWIELLGTYEGRHGYNETRGGDSGPQMSGETHASAKLTRKQVVEIRNCYSNKDVTQVDLAKDYGVTKTCIGEIVRGERWSNTEGPIIDAKNYNNLKKQDVVEMRKRYAKKSITQKELGEEYGIGRTYVSRILRGVNWSDASGPIKK